MAPKKIPLSGKTEKVTDVTDKKRQQRRSARVAPLLQAGPYESTPKRDKTRAAVAPRNILGDYGVAASPATKDSPQLLQSEREKVPPKPSQAGDLKSSPSSSPSNSPVMEATKKKKKKSFLAFRSPKKKSGSPPKKEAVSSSTFSLSGTSGRATPASNPATGSDSARRLRSYSHSLKRSTYGSTSKLRSSSLRRSIASDSSASLSTSKTTPPSALHTSFVKDEKASPTKLSEPRGSLPRRSVGAIDASFVRHSRVNTPLQTSAAGDEYNTPFRERGPKVASQRPEAEPTQKYTQEQLSLWDKQIKSWLNKPWKLCCLSAMSSFDIQKENLRSSYQKALRNRINELLPFSVKVELETVHCFTRSQHVTDAVVLTISYSIPRELDLRKSPKSKEKSESAHRRVLYKSLMIRALLRDSQADRAGVSWYPLYLYNGQERLHQAVEQWLTDSFGAYTSLKSLQATALLWAAGLWYQQSCGAKLLKPVPVSLSYALAGLSADGWQQHRQYPASSHRVRDASFLTLEMPADQMRNLALCVLPESDEACVTGAERDFFHTVVQQLVGNLTCLPQSALRLLSVRTACVTLTRNGQVKISCKQHFLGLLQWLLEMHREDSLLEQVAYVDDLSQNLDD